MFGNKNTSRNSVAPISDVTELISVEDEKYDHDYIMPSLPMKFSFNRLYILPNSQGQQLESVDYSLKAIFSKNANKLQKKRRNLFIGIFATILLVILALILVIIIVIILGGDKAASEEGVIIDSTM